MSAVTMPASRQTEFRFDTADHAAISAFVYEEAGILMPPGKMQLVYGRLAPRFTCVGRTTFQKIAA